MDWNKVIGANGRAYFKQRTYTNSNGEERTVNDLANFIDYDPKFFIEDKIKSLPKVDGDLPF